MGYRYEQTFTIIKNTCVCVFKKIVVITALGLFLLPSSAKTETVSAEQFIEFIDSMPMAQIIDVRPAQYRETAYIRNSISIPVEELQSRLNEIDFSKPILVYCQTGKKSAEAVKILSAKQPSTLVELFGGITQIFAFLAKEPEEIKQNPGKKALFDKARALLITGPVIVGLKLPELSFSDATGKKISTSIFKSKPFILVFIFAGDTKQADTVLNVVSKYQKKKSKITIIPVAAYRNDNEKNNLINYLKGKKIKTAFYYDENGNTTKKMSLSSFPAFTIVDANGAVRANNISNAEGPVDACGNKTLDEMAEMVATGSLPPYPISESELNEMRQMKMVGSTAPDFSLNDFNGNTFKLSEIDTNGALIVFGTLHCPYTIRELETVNKCDNKVNDKPIQILAVLMVPDMQEAQRVKDFIGKEQIKYPVLMDTDGSVFEKYNVAAIPAWWVVGPDSVIRSREVGYSEATCDKVAKVLQQ